MKIVVAMDSFKGSLTALEACDAVERGVFRVMEAELIKIPFADGGEGTVDVLCYSTNAQRIECQTTDPLGREIQASIAWFEKDKTAIVEMAQASGLGLIDNTLLNPDIATTYGTGILILKALELGCKKLVMGLGGSGTNDGGAGALAALGARFYDGQNNLLEYFPQSLSKVERVDFSGLPVQLRGVEVLLAADVTNPLLGLHGATEIYGAQKGVCDNRKAFFESLLLRLGSAYESASGIHCVSVPGAGAAGGLGAALIAALDGKIVGGAKFVSELSRLEKHIDGAELIITGEGAMDSQTLYGKAPALVAELGQKQGIMTIGFCGHLGEGYQKLYEKGFSMVQTIVSGPIEKEEAFFKGADLLEDAVWRFMKFFNLVTKSKCKGML